MEKYDEKVRWNISAMKINEQNTQFLKTHVCILHESYLKQNNFKIIMKTQGNMLIGNIKWRYRISTIQSYYHNILRIHM